MSHEVETFVVERGMLAPDEVTQLEKRGVIFPMETAQPRPATFYNGEGEPVLFPPHNPHHETRPNVT